MKIKFTAEEGEKEKEGEKSERRRVGKGERGEEE